MSDNGSDRAVSVFDPDASYGFVQEIRDAGVMPTPGLRYVAAVTGPWKIVKVIRFEGVEQLLQRLNAPGDDTATSFAPAKVRRSHYRDHTAFVRIETDVADPNELLTKIADALGIPEDDLEDELEADVIVGDFDILVCLSADDEETISSWVLAIRAIPGIRRTVTLRVLDYVSTSDKADADHRVGSA
jgi:hypothetical protein